MKQNVYAEGQRLTTDSELTSNKHILHGRLSLVHTYDNNLTPNYQRNSYDDTSAATLKIHIGDIDNGISLV
ncbi:hypothetical protein OUZ56_011450 [Daphnia magna]|uniref:Uncharacterized protein n=1 Tax=Daphnia magna TaxID=35525 RepID=A0ABQ9Z0D5_9CRUS|nr:hypothetical protein OUZ56_011450 [Daphnia magna]